MKTVSDIKFRENDVFRFKYNESEIKSRFSPYHCFDGQLIVKVSSKGELYLVDTYWASKYNNFTAYQDVKSKTIEDTMNQGELTFICNLDDVEEINDWETDYYDDSDFFNLSYQHSCYKYFVKKKGAAKSQTKMIESIKKKIVEAEYRKLAAESSIEQHRVTLLKIEAGDTSVYL